MSEKPTIKLSDEIAVDVVDPHNIIPVYAELVTELRVVGGVLHISFANLVIDGDTSIGRKAQVCARIRISANTLNFLTRTLAEPSQEMSSEGQTIN